MLLIFIPLNRKFGVQTSGCQFMFWFLMTVLSIPRCRTEARLNHERSQVDPAEPHDFSWDEYQFVSFFIFFAFTCIMLFLNCFSDGMPRQTKYKRGPNEIPELSASFLSRITYRWFDSMALKGYRNPLEEDDLWDLRPQDSCKEVMPTFAYYWNQNVRKNYKSKAGQQTTEPKAQFANGKVSFENPQGNGRKGNGQHYAGYLQILWRHLPVWFILQASHGYTNICAAAGSKSNHWLCGGL